MKKTKEILVDLECSCSLDYFCDTLPVEIIGEPQRKGKVDPEAVGVDLSRLQRRLGDGRHG